MPWGKDADLAYPKPKCIVQADCKGVGTKISEVLIGFHQNVISPADGPRSHFRPSSSDYTLTAIKKHGFFYGYLLGCDRLMRENCDKWIYPTVLDDYGDPMKFDPVR